MVFGLHLANLEPARLRCIAQTAEGLGYDVIVFPDHLVTEGPERQYDPHAHVHGVSDRAGPGRVSQYRRVRCCLPLLSTTSASRSKFLPRLYTRPARTPVNASQLSSRKATHDSGPLWVAGPLTCDSFIHNTSPVYPGARREANGNHTL